MKPATARWQQRIRDAVSRAGLPRFWRWWIRELAPLLPARWRGAIHRRFARPVIALTDGEAVIWRPEFSNGTARLVVAETVALKGDAAAVVAAGRAAVSRLAASASGGIAAPKVIVALDPKQILRKELTLPSAVEEDLNQTLAFDLDRYTPFRPEQVYFDAVIVGRDPARKLLRVDWAAALKTIVDGAVKQVQAWGAVPVAVVPGPPTAATTQLNLLPGVPRRLPLQWRRWQVWAPLALVVVLGLAAILVPLLQKREYAIALGAQTAAAAQRAQAADVLRQQLEATRNEYNYVLAKKYAYPSMVQVLDEVTRALPDDTWLTQLDVKTSGHGKDILREVYLRGESANAGKLISMLEDTKLVEQAAQRSPTTKVQGGPGEVFDLGARVRALPPPAAASLTANATPLPAVPPRAAAPPAAAAAAPATARPQATQPPPDATEKAAAAGVTRARAQQAAAPPPPAFAPPEPGPPVDSEPAPPSEPQS
ncbi:MAG TPA: PilN domain-containing protein [Casimicrobiaceae bacterium]|nr:PilN domain-containing protein [Casimicrobiaceae bacterium]